MITKQKSLVYAKQAEIVQAIAHPLRIAILDFLADGPQCVCDIAEFVGSERSNVSRHLSVMVKAGLLQQHKEGLNVIYRVKTQCKMLAEHTERAVKELGIDGDVEKVTDIKEIMKFGVMTTPALAVDGQIKVVGKVPTLEEIKKILS
jgi:small redox-active disulfide protein 2